MIEQDSASAVPANAIDGRRPPVSVIVPFHGSAEEARQVIGSLAGIEVAPGDELILVDNTPQQAATAAEAVRVVPATAQQSSYHARNVGAEAARNPWLLFLDSDCRPVADIIDRYFTDPPAEGTGLVSGEVLPASSQDGLVPRYARSRRHLSQADAMRHPHMPLGVTANLLVRKAAWEDVGGFLEGIRSGGDTDFCWRVQERGWSMEYRAEAAVEHAHRETVRALARQMARYGAGRAWLARRHPGSRGRPRPLREFARCAAGALVWTLTGRFERARFKLLDAVSVAAEATGFLLANVPPAAQEPPPPGAARGLRLVVCCDSFPELSETFVVEEVRALMRAGHTVRVEASARSRRPNRDAARSIPAHYLDDDGFARRLLCLAALGARHPLRCLRDLAARRRWRRAEHVRPLHSLAPRARRLAAGGEHHLHVHFASGAALDALRLSRLLGVTYSVTAHAYEIFQHPANLEEKLRCAAFVTTGCDYNVRYLREIVDGPTAGRIHEIVMGVDGESFRRASPYPGGRTVVAVGRLVEKKGFVHLVRAAARLSPEALECVRIVGDGRLRDDLEREARDVGVGDRIEFLGALDPAGVRAVLEGADVLAMPCVVAADGDRDSMPVVVKEALAMEIPVVASDEVGLPELVRSGWGRLVPPEDPGALAEALEELLALPADERAAMGRAGREWVLEHCSVDGETDKLAQLLAPFAGR